jgi:hypothetical protein
MKADLSASAVRARLAALRASYVPMTADEAHERMRAPPRPETFEEGVARRLAELRSLMALTERLQRRR